MTSDADTDEGLAGRLVEFLKLTGFLPFRIVETADYAEIHTASGDGTPFALTLSPSFFEELNRLAASRLGGEVDREAWRPIDTAPDTPHFKALGWCCFGRNHEEAEARMIQRDWRGNWYGHGCQQKVTHWMPIPAPPTPDRGEG